MSTSKSIALSAKKVFSSVNRKNCLALLAAKKTEEFNINLVPKKAAVLVPLCEVDQQAAILYTVRADHLRSNGREVAFPGGMFDKKDKSLQDTALRETQEEIGFEANQVDVWGKCPEIYRKDVIVTPYLGYIGRFDRSKLQINSNEVSSVFPVTLEVLTAPDQFATTQFRFGKTVYRMPVYLGARQRIWGLTACITHTILTALVPDHYSKNINFHFRMQKILNSKRNAKTEFLTK